MGEHLAAPADQDFRWVEKDHATYVYEPEHGRCVAFARRRAADREWEVKLTGPDNAVYVAQHRGQAHGKLRQLVGLDGAL